MPALHTLSVLVAAAAVLSLAAVGAAEQCITCGWCTRVDGYWKADAMWWSVLAIQCKQPTDPSVARRLYYNLTRVRYLAFELYNENRVPLSFRLSYEEHVADSVIPLDSGTSCLRLHDHVPRRYVPAGKPYAWLQMKSDKVMPYKNMATAYDLELDCTPVYKYVWTGAPWAPSCAEGGGVQSRKTAPSCVDTTTGTTVGPTYCEENAETGTGGVNRVCQVAWKAGAWGACGQNPPGECSSVRNATKQRPLLVDYKACAEQNDSCSYPNVTCVCGGCAAEEMAQSGMTLEVPGADHCTLDACRAAVCAHATSAAVYKGSDEAAAHSLAPAAAVALGLLAVLAGRW
eukprot:m51a1_g10013 hypothetical protein (344) ;mRNA; f:27840-29031